MRDFGKVTTFNEERGFGFIAPDLGGKDVFVHARQIEKAGLDVLEVGDRVSYELGTSRDGRTEAIDIELVN